MFELHAIKMTSVVVPHDVKLRIWPGLQDIFNKRLGSGGVIVGDFFGSEL